MFIPGTVFWALVGIGIATKNEGMIGAAVVMFAAVAGFVITHAIRASRARQAAQRQIWTEGLASRATVVALSTTGGGLNDHPQVDLELDVLVPGAAPYRVTVQTLVSLLAIPRVQPSCEIGIHVDRTDRNRVVIDAALTPYGYGG